MARICRQTSIPETRGQHHVEQDHRRPGALELLQCLDAVGGGVDEKPLGGERDRQGVAVGRLVVDDEHERWIGHQRSSRKSGAAVGSIGMRSRNVEPSPSRDSTVTSPLCACATLRTMASPSPVPPVVRLRARSTETFFEHRTKCHAAAKGGQVAQVADDSGRIVGRSGKGKTNRHRFFRQRLLHLRKTFHDIAQTQ